MAYESPFSGSKPQFKQYQSPFSGYKSPFSDAGGGNKSAFSNAGKSLSGEKTGGGLFDLAGRSATEAVNSIPPVYTPEKATSPFGSESGPGILESWFNQRATGTDPAFEYASRRGISDLANRYAAAGSFNSGAARQGESDFMANLIAQRQGQLDALAGGASGEHMGRLNAMFNQGLGLAGGQAGLASAYDLGAAGNIEAANRAINEMNLRKAGVDEQFRQGRLNTLGSGYALYLAGK